MQNVKHSIGQIIQCLYQIIVFFFLKGSDLLQNLKQTYLIKACVPQAKTIKCSCGPPLDIDSNDRNTF